jgi:D-amino-acid dehydrogenase
VARRSLGRSIPPLYMRLAPSAATVAWLLRFARHCGKARYRRGCEALANLSVEAPGRLADLRSNGVSVDITGRGMLHVFAEVNDARDALKEASAVARDGLAGPDRLMDRGQLLALEPALGDRVRAGFLYPEEQCVDPRQFTAALVATVERAGATIHPGAPVTGFTVERGRVSAVHRGSQRDAVERVIICAGVWSGRLAAQLGARTSLIAGRGYSLDIALPSPPQLGLHLSDVHLGLSPTPTGVRIAAAMELSGPGQRPHTARRLKAIVRCGDGYVKDWPTYDPVFADTGWSGMRPLTADGLPVIGPLPELANAYVNAGHGMWGITLSLPSGAAIAELVLSGHAPNVLAPFTPARFST